MIFNQLVIFISLCWVIFKSLLINWPNPNHFAGAKAWVSGSPGGERFMIVIVIIFNQLAIIK